MAFTKSQLEIFVETYLKSLKSHLVKRSDRKYIQKAINMIIAITTDSPCCTNPDDTIELFTPFDNKLTSTVSELLQKIDRRRHKQSIERTLNLLRNILVSTCCNLQPINVVIDSSCSPTPVSLKISFIGQNGQQSKVVIINSSTNFTMNIAGDYKIIVEAINPLLHNNQFILSRQDSSTVFSGTITSIQPIKQSGIVTLGTFNRIEIFCF